ncbi:hypothetical protein [uncultured Chloroflexus sp.]|uniref:hypothetical protein n=1 Tax=uncultured Chloroflexus sp. TaxID=214040 RepID=UPI002634DB16|nr:hypothetical protein [uncultured Chloroflexus sp.]
MSADLIFKPRAASFRVEMPIRPQHRLGVNPVDSELDTRAAVFSATEREHVRQFLARAHLFAELVTPL